MRIVGAVHFKPTTFGHGFCDGGPPFAVSNVCCMLSFVHCFCPFCNTVKIVVRGARGVGKSMLVRRLRGEAFDPHYTPTREIDTANINWSYKTSTDIINVDVWDVVDRLPEDEEDAPMPIVADDMPAGLPGNGSAAAPGAHAVAACVADNVDVYSGAHGVMFVYDVSQPESLEYVRAGLLTVPTDLPVLILGNKRDLPDSQRAVPLHAAEDLASEACRARARPMGGRRAQAFECSLKNCFGLKVLYHYLNLPFLELKVSTMLRQLKELKEDLATTRDEVSTYVEAQDYDSYTAWLTATSKPSPDSSIDAPLSRDPFVPSPAMASLPVQSTVPPGTLEVAAQGTPNEFVRQAA